MKKWLLLMCLLPWNVAMGQNNDPARVAFNCVPASARTTIAVNNIRANLLGSGPHWGPDTSGRGFEVPAGSGLSSMYAGSLWMGGLDPTGALRVAAQTYRQTSTLGAGFWPGPLSVDNGSTNGTNCRRYDSLWRVTAQEIRNHVLNYNQPGYQMPSAIANWPGNGEVGFDSKLAPYVDFDANGAYNPANGDYPKIYGDEAIFSVYNGNGNIAGSGGLGLPFEVREMIYAFNRPGPLNNAIFHEYTIINRSSLRIDSFYAGVFIDPDLGNAIDDYVGCDVSRSMAYAYNADNDDDGILGYGTQPPAVGVAIFQGAFSDPQDGRDNNLDGTIDNLPVDCQNQPRTERYAMWNFLAFNNDATPTGNPTTALHVYNYLRGRWKDGLPMVYGGNGYPASPGATTSPARYMFPGNSDPNGFGLGGSPSAPVTPPFQWSETVNGTNNANVAGDRRFVMSMGPMTMPPGSINTFTIGTVWARAQTGGPQASLTELLQNTSQIRALFDDCSIFGLNALSVNDVQKPTFKVYPNPAKNQVMVSGNFEAKPVNVQLYDLQGRLVRTFNAAEPEGNALKLDLQGLNAGSYLLKWQTRGFNQVEKLWINP